MGVVVHTGIAKWATGEWKANLDATINYKTYMEHAMNDLLINFTKVKGHSGDVLNDKADLLAKEAAEIE